VSDSDPIIRLNAALEDRYRIESELGEGGMANVYLADDLKHERKVALKVLKPELAAVVGAERFLAEIKTTANLQHPHILPLFDSGEADTFLFYVMPYVEGESLRERLDRERQLPVDDAARIATNMAEALDYAHRQGVIHRDIKPANVLLQDGKPVISDFGIALAVGAAGGGRLTETGLSLGTPLYMSPEQATGDLSVGAASDVYALGCVLYEMLVGEPPYTGSTAQAILGKIIAGKLVSATEHRRSVPANVDAAIRKALEKVPADRFAGAQDFARALADPGFRHGEEAGAAVGGAGGGWNRVTVTMAVFAVAASVAAVAGWMRSAAPPPAVARFPAPFLEGQLPVGGPFELTPDGSALVYVGRGAGGRGSQLWIRHWDELDAKPIPGTEGARVYPDAGRFALSPDGSEVAFVAGEPGPLRVVPLAGGPSRTLAPTAWNVGWSDDDWVYFMRAGVRTDWGLSRVRSAGGETETLTEPSGSEVGHAFPQPLPGGDAVLYQVLRAENGSDAEIWSLDLRTSEPKTLIPGNNPTYSASGHLFFGTADGTLMAAPFDAERVALTGSPIPIAEGAFTTRIRGNVVYSIGADGTLAYLAGESSGGLHELIWVTRSGDVSPVDAGEVFVLSPTGYDGWRLSPDGSRIAFVGSVDGNDDIWVKALPDGPVSRLTFSEDLDLLPQWAPDGRSVTYNNGPSGEGDLWSMRADGAGEPELVFDGFDAVRGVWSPDGEWLVLNTGAQQFEGQRAAHDIYGFRPGVDSVALPLIATEGFREQAPAISSDGRWLAYSSNETGRYEIFVRPFPNVDEGKWQVSTRGGINPMWAHNGRELFFLDTATRNLTVAEFTTTPALFQVSGVTSLFEVPSRIFWGGTNDPYDVDLDDQRFLMARVYGSEYEDPTLVLVQNFFEELKTRVPN